MGIIRKNEKEITIPNWPQLKTGLHPDVKKAFTNLQKEILVAITRAPIKKAGAYLDMSRLVKNLERDFDELLQQYEKPLPAATEQEHIKITTYIISQNGGA